MEGSKKVITQLWHTKASKAEEKDKLQNRPSTQFRNWQSTMKTAAMKILWIGTHPIPEVQRKPRSSVSKTVTAK